ncbi:hypothetical protein PPERSA_05110 [Pseudocohnilembus persalinus]|uniref:Serine/threonine-protein phosphatase PGAM5, mitochondrial n=1 Tax=Pseudocohnilembus persalinus TaxID=266149 RepID=A0A0V0QWD4_PSEPJ|nr:hypothetical protein PPERSA_05110 [Pseudocohnilembus persalinus]|eukprot:KRX06497.1 hypothetical protein PPERSA_05110 [Pseudocohnilembus persalinus]
MFVKTLKNLQNLTKQTQFKKNQFNFSISQQDLQEKQRQEEKADAQNNRLKFILLTASLGGGMLGYGVGTMIHNSEEVQKAVKEAEQQLEKVDEINKQATNIEQQKTLNGKWNQNWDGLHHLYENELLKKKEEQQQQNLNNSKSEGSVQSNNSEQKQNQQAQNIQKKKRGRRYITLVRHGQYIWADDDNGRKLSKIGKEQAKLTGKRLNELGEIYDKIYVSSMTRAKETKDGDLSEGFPNIPSPCQGETLNTISENLKPEEQERIKRAFQKYFKRIDEEEEGDSHELYVIHGNVIRYLLTQALQFPEEGWLRMATGNCGITQFIISPNGNVSLRRFGETGTDNHLNQAVIPGPFTVVSKVQFNFPFEIPPQVFLTFKEYYFSDKYDKHYQISVENINQFGFDIVYHTKTKKMIWKGQVNWIAIDPKLGEVIEIEKSGKEVGAVGNFFETVDEHRYASHDIKFSKKYSQIPLLMTSVIGAGNQGPEWVIKVNTTQTTNQGFKLISQAWHHTNLDYIKHHILVLDQEQVECEIGEGKKYIWSEQQHNWLEPHPWNNVTDINRKQKGRYQKFSYPLLSQSIKNNNKKFIQAISYGFTGYECQSTNFTLNFQNFILHSKAKTVSMEIGVHDNTLLAGTWWNYLICNSDKQVELDYIDQLRELVGEYKPYIMVICCILGYFVIQQQVQQYMQAQYYDKKNDQNNSYKKYQ